MYKPFRKNFRGKSLKQIMVKTNNDPAVHKPGKDDFFIVGIGASAGGIQALQEFFPHVPKIQAWLT